MLYISFTLKCVIVGNDIGKAQKYWFIHIQFDNSASYFFLGQDSEIVIVIQNS